VREEAHQGDDWDRPWEDRAEAATRDPAQAMRRLVVHSLLRVSTYGARILDIGCGQGDLLEEMRGRHPQTELCGIDYSQHGLEVARIKVPGATFLQRDLLSGAAPPSGLPGWATHATCSEVLEHVDRPQAPLSCARGYLAPGCRLVVTVPSGPISAFARHIGHRRHFTLHALRQLLTDLGLQVENGTGVGFPLFNRYRLVVIGRGQRLVEDVAGGGTSGRGSWPARIAMACFQLLLAAPQPHTPWGWQLAALGRVND
jgi:SAM-dependent methyltransferase